MGELAHNLLTVLRSVCDLVDALGHLAVIVVHLARQLADPLVKRVVLSLMLALLCFQSLLQVSDLHPADFSVFISPALLVVDLIDFALDLL